jgi:hypothetical protein
LRVVGAFEVEDDDEEEEDEDEEELDVEERGGATVEDRVGVV